MQWETIIQEDLMIGIRLRWLSLLIQIVDSSFAHIEWPIFVLFEQWLEGLRGARGGGEIRGWEVAGDGGGGGRCRAICNSIEVDAYTSSLSKEILNKLL